MPRANSVPPLRTIAVAAALAALLPALARPQEASSGRGPGVTLVRVEGQLDVGALSLLRRAIDEAQERGDRLVVELDTPGGQVDLMWKIARALDAASRDGVTTVTWVHDHALSAGALVALATDAIYMRSVAQMGSATPVQIGPGGIAELPEDVREKTYSHLRSGFRAWAEEHGRSGLLAEAMVDAEVEVREVLLDGVPTLMSESEYADAKVRGEDMVLVRTISPRGELLNLTGPMAVELGMADGIAESPEELFDKIGAAGTAPNVIERTPSEDVASWLAAVTPLLLMLGIVLAYVELKAPGFGLPGFAAIACFAVVLVGRYLVGLADVPQFVLVGLGIVLVVVEIFFVPGTIWIGLLGAVLAIAGLVWANVGPGVDFSYSLDRALAFDALRRLVWSSVAAVVVMMVLSRILPKTPILRRLVLDPDARAADFLEAATQPRDARGAVGRAITDLRPVGKVVLDGDDREHEARVPGGALESGARVRVVEVSGGRLVVEPVQEGSA